MRNSAVGKKRLYMVCNPIKFSDSAPGTPTSGVVLTRLPNIAYSGPSITSLPVASDKWRYDTDLSCPEPHRITAALWSNPGAELSSPLVVPW